MRWVPVLFVLLVLPLRGQETPDSVNGTAASAPKSTPAAMAESIASSASQDSVTVEVTKSVDAIYPAEGLKRKREGEVVVNVTIALNGDVENAEVVSGDRSLAPAAITAARQWKFKSWKYMDLPIRSWAKLSFVFKLPQTASLQGSAPTVSGKLTESGGLGDPVWLSPLVIQGMLLKKVQPKYPKEAMRDKAQGTVIVSMVVGKDGNVRDVNALSGPPQLRNAATDAVKQWKFKPYLLLGQPAEARGLVDIVFVRPDVPPPPPSIQHTTAGGSTTEYPPGVTPGVLVSQVPPKYPEIAREHGVHGNVVLTINIAKDGSVRDPRVVTGDPLLNLAAIEAVKQWRYRPYLLDGKPIEVGTTVTVPFP